MERIPWFRPVRHLIRKEFRQLFRDFAMVRILLFVPLIQLFIFGYAVNTDLRHVRVSVLDEDRTESSRNLIRSFFASDLFVRAPVAESAGELKNLLMAGDADLTIWIPKGFGKDVSRLDNAGIGVVVDGQNSSMAGRALGYAQAIVRLQTQKILDDWKQSHPNFSPPPRIESVTRFFYNPQLESRFYMIPGVVTLILTLISTLLTGMAVVKEKEIGTLEQLMVTPLTPFQLITGKTVPFALLAFFDLGFATTVAILWFKLPLAGSVFVLAGSALIFLLVTLGIGLLVSTVSHTQQQAQFTVWFILMTGILTSGFFYPIANMPNWVQVLTYVNPLRYFMDIIRGVFLRGSGWTDIVRDIVPLLILGMITFTAAVLRFQKRVS